MAGSKRKKEVKQKVVPNGRYIAQGGDPERYYCEYPAWAFVNSDQEMWAFSQDHMGESFWTEVLPRLKALEAKTWSEILVRDKKQNHSMYNKTPWYIATESYYIAYTIKRPI